MERLQPRGKPVARFLMERMPILLAEDSRGGLSLKKDDSMYQNKFQKSHLLIAANAMLLIS